MSNAKFYILGGGRWRELDTSAGRVEGWGGARFMYVERGRLRAVRRAPVLRGLRALAAGKAHAVRDGPPLSQIRLTANVKDQRAPHSCCERRARCLLAHCACGLLAPCGAPRPAPPQAPPPAAFLPSAAEPFRPSHAAVQTDLPPPAAQSVLYNHHNSKITKKQSVAKHDQTEPAVPRSKIARRTSSDDLSASMLEWNRNRKMRELRGAELCKELIISEEDVVLLRNFIEKDAKNVFKVDLERFDADDTYKSKVFYKLNPLVNVERCKAIADMTRERRSQSTVTLKDFITNLGLRRVDDPSPSRSSYRMRKRRDTRNPRESESEQDKENLASRRRPKVNKRPHKVLGESVEGKPNSDRIKGKIKASEVSSSAARGERRAERSAAAELSDGERAAERAEPAGPPKRAAGGGREYSAAEDAAILRWLREAGRGRLVNGNRVWRQLQPEHRRLTGHFRSWHSLRNRYLRYLLPALGALLEQPEAAALRAAAARGEIKTRARGGRGLVGGGRELVGGGREPLAPPPLLGAWARRPRPKTHHEEPDKSISEPTRSLRSDIATTSLTNSHADTPTYSELTRRFAERHRSTPKSDESVTEPEMTERRASKRLRVARNVYSIPLDDKSSRRTDVSDRRAENSINNVHNSKHPTARSTRHADRSNKNVDNLSRQTDNTSQTTDSVDRRQQRTRRLYNPNT